MSMLKRSTSPVDPSNFLRALQQKMATSIDASFNSENIYARTQRFIHSAAANVVSLNNSNNNTSSITHATNESANNSIPNDTTKTPKSVVGHPYRYTSPCGSRGKEGEGKSTEKY